jgi:GntR family transcriptional regulator
MPVGMLRKDARPLYAQAIEALYELVEDGVYRPRDLLPSEAELARQLGVSRSTVREAIGHLVRAGLVTRRQGVGTFVAERASERLTAGLERLQSFRTLAQHAGFELQLVQREITTVAATQEWADALSLPAGSPLVRVQVTEAVEGRPTAFLDSVISGQMVNLTALRAAEGSLLDYLVEHTTVPLAYTRSALCAVDADAALAARLSVPEGKSLLNLIETTFSEADEPLAFSRNYFLTDWFQLMIVRRIVKRPPRGAR